MSDGRLRPPLASTDAELAARLTAGDPDGLAELHARHALGIHDFVARFVRDASAAEDLTHSTFLRAWERRGTPRDPARVRAWLYSLAYDLGLEHVTRSRPADVIDAAAGAEIESTARGPEEAAVAQEIADLVWAAASSLEPRQYAVLDLSARRDLTPSEIADALGVPVARAWVLVNRAREALANAVRSLLVARQRDHCGRLAMLVPAGVDSLTSQLRSRVDHHMRQCADCRLLGRCLTHPAQVLPALVPLPLPAKLAIEGRARLLAGIQAVHGPAAAATPACPRGRGRTAAAAAVLSLLLLAGAAYLFRPAGAQLSARPASVGPVVAAAPQATAAPSPSPADAPAPEPATPPAESTPASALPVPPPPAVAALASTQPPPTPEPVVAPTPTPVPAPTPEPPFAVASVTVRSLDAGSCQAQDLLGLNVVCTFDVVVRVVNATGQEVVVGALTATSTVSGRAETASFQAPVTAPGASSTSVRVAVRFFGCAEGTASATTRPAGPAAAGATRFGRCDRLLPL